MTAITNWIVRHPALALLLALLITVGLGIGIRDLEFDTSNRGLMAKGDPAVAFYENVIATFGEDSILSIVVKSEDIFQEDILHSIERLTIAGGAIEGVSRVVSLTTVSNLEGRDGVLSTDDLLLTIPSDPAELAAIRESALSNDLLLGEVVSKRRQDVGGAPLPAVARGRRGVRSAGHRRGRPAARGRVHSAGGTAGPIDGNARPRWFATGIEARSSCTRSGRPTCARRCGAPSAATC